MCSAPAVLLVTKISKNAQEVWQIRTPSTIKINCTTGIKHFKQLHPWKIKSFPPLAIALNCFTDKRRHWKKHKCKTKLKKYVDTWNCKDSVDILSQIVYLGKEAVKRNQIEQIRQKSFKLRMSIQTMSVLASTENKDDVDLQTHCYMDPVVYWCFV